MNAIARPWPVILLVALSIGCGTTRPAPEPPPDVAPPPPEPAPPPDVTPAPEPTPPEEPPAEPPPEPMPPEEEPPDFLYDQTADELRQAFTDALYTIYQGRHRPADARQLDAAQIRAFLADLDTYDPAASTTARERLGRLLREPNLVGFVLQGANPAACAQLEDVLYVPVPPRYQSAGRQGPFAFDGLIIRDLCNQGEALNLQCVGGRGERPDGTRCSCVCELAPGPATACTDC